MAALAWDPDRRILHASVARNNKVDLASVEAAIKALRLWLQIVIRPDDEAGAKKLEIRSQLTQHLIEGDKTSNPIMIDLKVKDRRFKLFEAAITLPENRIIQLIEFSNGYYLANSTISEEEHHSRSILNLALPLFRRNQDGILLDACGKPIYSLEYTNDISLFGGYLKQKVRINDEGFYIFGHLQTDHGTPNASELHDFEKRIKSPKKRVSDLDYSPIIYSGSKENDHVAQACWCLIADEINGEGVADYLRQYAQGLAGDDAFSSLFSGNYRRHLSASSMHAYLLKTKRRHSTSKKDRQFYESKAETKKPGTKAEELWPKSVKEVSEILGVPQRAVYHALQRREITCDMSRRKYADNRTGPLKFTVEGEMTYTFTQEQFEAAEVYLRMKNEEIALKKMIDDTYVEKNSAERKAAQRWRQRQTKRLKSANPGIGDLETLKRVAALVVGMEHGKDDIC